MFVTLNAARWGSNAGFLRQSTKLDLAASRHAAYMIANPTELSHSETPGHSLFSGTSATERAIAAGYVGRVSEEFAFGSDCVPSLLATVWHLVGLLQGHRDVGLAQLTSSNGSNLCVIELGYVDSPQVGEAGTMVVYPANNESSVSLGFALDTESPRPLPQLSGIVGQPIYVGIANSTEFEINATSSVSITSFKITDPTGASVPALLLKNSKAVVSVGVETANDPSTDLYLSTSQMVLVPKTALKTNTTYVVDFSATYNGILHSKRWSFSTGAAGTTDTLSSDDLARIDAQPPVILAPDTITFEDGTTLSDYFRRHPLNTSKRANALSAPTLPLPPVVEVGQTAADWKRNVIQALVAQAAIYACGRTSIPDNPACADRFWKHAAENPPELRPAQNWTGYVFGSKQLSGRSLPQDLCVQQLYGVDCSGMVGLIAADLGITLKATDSKGQSDPKNWILPDAWPLQIEKVEPRNGAVAVDLSSIQQGDIVVWKGHVGYATTSGRNALIVSSAGGEVSTNRIISTLNKRVNDARNNNIIPPIIDATSIEATRTDQCDANRNKGPIVLRVGVIRSDSPIALLRFVTPTLNLTIARICSPSTNGFLLDSTLFRNAYSVPRKTTLVLTSKSDFYTDYRCAASGDSDVASADIKLIAHTALSSFNGGFARPATGSMQLYYGSSCSAILGRNITGDIYSHAPDASLVPLASASAAIGAGCPP